MARRYRLTLGDIANTVRQQSVDMPTGQLQNKDGDLLVRFTDERRTPDAIQKPDGQIKRHRRASPVKRYCHHKDNV